MSKGMFDKNISYTERFIKKHGKTIDFPFSQFMDAKFHPKYKDHLVVVSKVVCPKDLKFKYMSVRPNITDDELIKADEKLYFACLQ